MAEVSSDVIEESGSSKEVIKVQKSEFVSLDSPSQELKQNLISTNLPSINLSRAQPKANKIRDVFGSTDSSPKNAHHQMKSSEYHADATIDFEEDPLDAYMKTIKYDAAEQDDLG